MDSGLKIGYSELCSDNTVCVSQIVCFVRCRDGLENVHCLKKILYHACISFFFFLKHADLGQKPVTHACVSALCVHLSCCCHIDPAFCATAS